MNDEAGNNGPREATGAATDDIACIELVELVTEYLDDALPADVRDRIDAHLPYCDGCSTVMAQFRRVVELAGTLSEDDVSGVDAGTRADLLDAFKDSRSAEPDV